jgi:tripartite-type tricarboxylate transporter receptor subunit TctC
MKIARTATVSRILLGCLTLLGMKQALADEYPNRPVTIIVPFAAGGPVDTVARSIAPVLAAQLGQPFVVENVSGGASMIGMTRVARAAPDGYTLLLHNVNIALVPNAALQPDRDYAAIGLINSNPMVLVGRKSIPARSIEELAAWMKVNQVKIAHPGSGTQSHLAGVLLTRTVGAGADYIPYRGGGPALQDVIAGHVDLFFGTPQAAAGALKAGTVHVFGSTSNESSHEIPSVPPLATVLGPQLSMLYWHALFAPAKTPPAILERLNGALQVALNDAKLVGIWSAAGVRVYPNEQRTSQAAQDLLRSEVKRWGDVVRENKIETNVQ